MITRSKIIIITTFTIYILLCLITFDTFAQKPKDSAELRALGDDALSRHKYNEAIQYFTELIDLEPKNEYNYYKRALVYLRLRKYQHVLADLNKSITLDPKFIQGYTNRAKVYILRGDCDKAVVDYKTILQIKPDHKAAAEELRKASECSHAIDAANNAFDRRDYNLAKDMITKALEVSTECIELYLLRAKCHFEMNNHHDVLHDTRTVLKFDENHVDGLLLRGISYYKLGEPHDIEAASNHFKRALKFDPEHQETKKMAKKVKLISRALADGQEAMNQNKYDVAIETLTNIINVDPHHHVIMPRIHLLLCQANTKASHAADAINHCTSALKFDDRRADIYISRADAYILDEKFQEATNDCQRAQEISNDQASQECLRKAQLEQKKASRKDFYKILDISKDFTQAQLKKAYRKKALEWHPDKVSAENKEKAVKMFQDIGEAYEVLSDNEKRQRYDAGEDIRMENANPFQHFQQQFPFGFGQGQGQPHFTFTFG